MNMVSSVNGVASVGGRAAGIGGSADRKAMRELRSRVDAVMVGAGTLRAERMRLGLDDPSLPQPLAVIVCGQKPPPLAGMLLRDSRQRVLLVVPEEASRSYDQLLLEDVELMPAPSLSSGRVDLRSALDKLRADHSVSRLLIEGGPTINGALFAQDLVDELFVTIAPSLLPSTGANIVNVQTNHKLKLLSARAVGDEVFLRYTVSDDSWTP